VAANITADLLCIIAQLLIFYIIYINHDSGSRINIEPTFVSLMSGRLAISLKVSDEHFAAVLAIFAPTRDMHYPNRLARRLTAHRNRRTTVLM